MLASSADLIVDERLAETAANHRDCAFIGHKVRFLLICDLLDSCLRKHGKNSDRGEILSPLILLDWILLGGFAMGG